MGKENTMAGYGGAHFASEMGESKKEKGGSGARPSVP